ncbi:hypothetical protein [Candidatus Poriferisodalis sp.]|uniref:hypothetical protein n=1 Tax=Candidatus Poriferisodalis sp. TaxID=3101277 RepID=UPI003C6F7D7A
MLDCNYVLSARWADNFDIIASGEIVGADEQELVTGMLDRHHEDICAVGGAIDEDIFWGIEQWSEPDDLKPRWQNSNLGAILTVPIPCRTACADHPDAAAPPVQLTATFVPWEPNLSYKPPKTVIGAVIGSFLAATRKPRKCPWHPSLGHRGPVSTRTSSSESVTSQA